MRKKLPPVNISVQMLGYPRISVEGTPVYKWDGVTPYWLALFFLYKCRHHWNIVGRNKGSFTFRDEVFATFWPEMTVKEATNIFHVTKRKISDIILKAAVDAGRDDLIPQLERSTQNRRGEESRNDFSLTTYKQGLYILSGWVSATDDVSEFERAYALAMTEDHYENPDSWKSALKCYDPFLNHEKFDAEWMVSARYDLGMKYNTIIHRLKVLTDSD